MSKNSRKIKRISIKNIYQKSTEYLFKISTMIKENILAKSYNKTAYKLCLKHKIKNKYKRQFCKKCFINLISNLNCKTYFNEMFVVECICGNKKIYPLLKDPMKDKNTSP
ncbi:Ribonuclease P protein component 4 [Dictyocoela muelleri]|nr:Ribonuclease P protein component 4 [Dictyocoela muelleri]